MAPHVSLIAVGIAAAFSLAPPVVTEPASSAPFCALTISEAISPVCAPTERELDEAWAQSPLSIESNVRIAILYDNANMDDSAGSTTIYSSTSCTATISDIDFSVSNLGSWNNRVSSFQAYSGCTVRLWSNTSFSGSAYPNSSGFSVSSSYVGNAFNDTAESAQFS